MVFVEAEDRENCKPYVAYNLEELASTIVHLISRSNVEDHDDEFEFLVPLEMLTNPQTRDMCRVLVEGRDDTLVLNEFFRKSGLKFGKHFVMSKGLSGGFESVLATVKLLKRLKTNMPLLVVVDSDSKKSEKLELLRAYPKINIIA